MTTATDPITRMKWLYRKVFTTSLVTGGSPLYDVTYEVATGAVIFTFTNGTQQIGSMTTSLAGQIMPINETVPTLNPTLLPAVGLSPFHVNTSATPAILSYWDGTIWYGFGAKRTIPTKGTGAPTLTPTAQQSIWYIDTAPNPDVLYYWNGTTWASLASGVGNRYNLVLDNLTADNTPIINAALQLAGVTEVILPIGVIELNSPINLPDGVTLRGAGTHSTTLKLKSTFAFTSQNNGAVIMRGKKGFGVSDLTINCNKIYGTNEVTGLLDMRLNAVRIMDSKHFLVERVHAYNATGYSFWPVGSANTPDQTHLMTENGAFRDCWSYNANVHFEPLRCNDVLFDNCHSRDGDGDIPTEAGFHPYVFGKRLTFNNCSHDADGAGLLVVASGGPLLDIAVNGGSFTSRNAPAILSDSQGNRLSVFLTGAAFESLVTHGTDIGGGGGGADWLATGSSFKGYGSGISVAGLVTGGQVNFRASNCLVQGTCTNPLGQASGWINSNVSVMGYFDGTMRAIGLNNANAIAKGGVLIALSDNTRIEPRPSRNSQVFLRDQGQTVAHPVVAGQSCRLNIQLSAECLVVGESHLDVSIVKTTGGVPSGHMSYEVEMLERTPFITVWVLGDHAGKTFSWKYSETFPG